MILSELDGFLAGIVVSREMIMPSEWMVHIWGDHTAGFTDEEEAGKVLGALMAMYNGIIEMLQNGSYAPLYDLDTDDSPLWEIWMDGFTYLKVTGWGWYYLSTVMDDYSRYIVAWRLCTSMAAEDVSATLEDALSNTGLSQQHRPKLLSDNGPCGYKYADFLLFALPQPYYSLIKAKNLLFLIKWRSAYKLFVYKEKIWLLG